MDLLVRAILLAWKQIIYKSNHKDGLDTFLHGFPTGMRMGMLNKLLSRDTECKCLYIVYTILLFHCHTHAGVSLKDL